MVIPMLKKGFYITGTDTGIGKTTVACHMLYSLNQQGYSTIGIKPLASGCELTPNGWQNDDALQLQKAASTFIPYHHVNPIALQQPTAPHIAAELSGVKLSVASLLNACKPTLAYSADYFIVEGIGGWQVPLNAHESQADFVAALDFPVILVVGMRLGCLNHTLLTYRDILACGIKVHGWIANCLEPDMAFFDEYLMALQQRLAIPLLIIVPYKSNS